MTKKEEEEEEKGVRRWGSPWYTSKPNTYKTMEKSLTFRFNCNATKLWGLREALSLF